MATAAPAAGTPVGRPSPRAARPWPQVAPYCRAALQWARHRTTLQLRGCDSRSSPRGCSCRCAPGRKRPSVSDWFDGPAVAGWQRSWVGVQAQIAACGGGWQRRRRHPPSRTFITASAQWASKSTLAKPYWAGTATTLRSRSALYGERAEAVTRHPRERTRTCFVWPLRGALTGPRFVLPDRTRPQPVSLRVLLQCAARPVAQLPRPAVWPAANRPLSPPSPAGSSYHC
jgi:hypothetical protein